MSLSPPPPIAEGLRARALPLGELDGGRSPEVQGELELPGWLLGLFGRVDQGYGSVDVAELEGRGQGERGDADQVVAADV